MLMLLSSNAVRDGGAPDPHLPGPDVQLTNSGRLTFGGLVSGDSHPSLFSSASSSGKQSGARPRSRMELILGYRLGESLGRHWPSVQGGLDGIASALSEVMRSRDVSTRQTASQAALSGDLGATGLPDARMDRGTVGAAMPVDGDCVEMEFLTYLELPLRLAAGVDQPVGLSIGRELCSESEPPSEDAWRTTLHCHLPELGEVEVRIRLCGSCLVAAIVAEDVNRTDWLDARLGELRLLLKRSSIPAPQLAVHCALSAARSLPHAGRPDLPVEAFTSSGAASPAETSASEIFASVRRAGIRIHESRELVSALSRFSRLGSLPRSLPLSIAEFLAWIFRVERGLHMERTQQALA